MELKKIFKKNKKEKRAIGQFNFSTLTQVKGIVKASKHPFILGTSEGESDFVGLEIAVALKNIFRKKGLSVFLNLDHGKSFKKVKEACDLGYDMVHFDGSHLSLEENIEKTKQVVKYAKKKKILVEGEVGILGTESSKIYKDDFKVKKEHLTKPEDAKRFVKETKVDCLAVSIGNFHGMKEKGENPRVDLERLRKIKVKSFLVLHGGSGIPEENIKEAIEEGIVKININTELRKSFTENLRSVLNNNTEEVTPYKYLPTVIEEIGKIVEKKMKLFYNDKLENNKKVK